MYGVNKSEKHFVVIFMIMTIVQSCRNNVTGKPENGQNGRKDL